MSGVLIHEAFQVVSLWDLHNYACKKTIPTYEILEAICVINAGTLLASCLGLDNQLSTTKASASQISHFVTVGERGVVRIWKSEG